MQQYLHGLEQQPAFQKGLQQILKGESVSSLHVAPATSTSAGVPRLPIKGELLRFASQGASSVRMVAGTQSRHNSASAGNLTVLKAACDLHCMHNGPVLGLWGTLNYRLGRCNGVATAPPAICPSCA